MTGRESKYAKLARYLQQQSVKMIRLTFAEIEGIIERELPKSARKHREWWANDRTGGHSHANQWLDEGWVTTEVDMGKEVAFLRKP